MIIIEYCARTVRSMLIYIGVKGYHDCSSLPPVSDWFLHILNSNGEEVSSPTRYISVIKNCPLIHEGSCHYLEGGVHSAL